MRTVTACLLCGQGAFKPLVSIRGPVAHRSEGPREVTTFMVCRECGFVFQNPTLGSAELDELYGRNYRTFDPPDDYQSDQKAYGEKLCDWVGSKLGAAGSGRTVLDIGCAAGFFLSAFRDRGWRAVGIDANPRWVEWGRNRLGLDLRSGFFDDAAFPGEQFDLILFSHVLEHLPDPIPTLKAIRSKLKPGGFAFIGAPNVLLPPRNHLQANFLARPHVCHYSSRTAHRILAKAGLAIADQDNWYPRGLRILAGPMVEDFRPTEEHSDDWKAIQHLYAFLTGSGKATTFGRNLALMIPIHYEALRLIAGKSLATTSMWKGATLEQVERMIEPGSASILRPNGGAASTMFESQHWPGALEPGEVRIMIGLGAGRAAEALSAELERTDSRLVICEPDPQLVRALCAIRDLNAVLNSDRVRLVVGPNLVFRRFVRKWFSQATTVRTGVNPWLTPELQRRYQPVEALVSPHCHSQSVTVS